MESKDQTNYGKQGWTGPNDSQFPCLWSQSGNKQDGSPARDELFGCSFELFYGIRNEGLSPCLPQPGQGTARSVWGRGGGPSAAAAGTPGHS